MSYVDDLPLKSQIFEAWKDRLGELGFFIDWGEPSCWACGFHYGAKYDIKKSDAGWSEILRCWDRIPLQRCHIVPRSLGGANDPTNLFLMCRECHDLAPNTTIPEVFFEWAQRQSFYVRDSSKILAAFNAYGIEPADQEELGKLIMSEAFHAWMSDKVGSHRPQSNYASVLSRFTPATLIGLAVHYRRTNMAQPQTD